VRLLADIIRGLDVVEAQTQLQFANKGSAQPLLKLLNSAIANAENNNELEKNNLYIKEIRVDQGPVLKRWLPKAHGRATVIRKRSSHISIILGEKVPTPAKKKEKEKVDAPTKVKDLKSLPVTEKDVKTETADKQALVQETMGTAPTAEKKPESFDVRSQGKHRHQQHQDKKNQKKGKIKNFFTRKAV